MCEVRSARAINQREKTRIRNLQYDRENEVYNSKIFIICLRSIGRAGKETIVERQGKLSGPYIEIRPAKLTNHTACTS